MKEIVEQVGSWSYLQQLPARESGFSLSLDLAEAGTQFNIFSYRDAEGLRRFSVDYDSTTKDYLARVSVGLNEFCDVSFICTNLAALEKILAAKLVSTLAGLGGERQYESLFRAKKIVEWSYIEKLPGEFAGFRLFISPRQPLRTVNGSYVILDYSDFAAESNLTVSYNVYRDEFFGEVRYCRTPQMIGTFDARELGELAGRLDSCLRPTLEELRGRLTQTKGEPAQ
jgi:hypothetical protein